jgi:hypothetical protein
MDNVENCDSCIYPCMFTNASVSEGSVSPWIKEFQRWNAKFYSLQDGFKDCDDISLVERDRKVALYYIYTICGKIRNEYEMLD